MAKCEDCEAPVVWLRKPDGGWMPPVEPLFDFAYNDHFTTTVDGIAGPVPQVYKRHECLSWEERQLKAYEREQEKRRLIEEDRERRAEAARVQAELEEARREAERAQRELDRRLEREEAQRRAVAAKKRREKEAVRQFSHAASLFTQRLLPFACDDCGAGQGEACRTDRHDTESSVYLWWKRDGCTSRYLAAPPDDRSGIHHTPRWGEDYDEETGAGTTPETVGPWPPSVSPRPLFQPFLANRQEQMIDRAGAYEMRAWLAQNYLYVFEPEKVWLTAEEEGTLTDWLATFGEIFEEVGNGPEGVADEGGRLTGDGRSGGGHARRDARSEEGRDDRVDPE